MARVHCGYDGVVNTKMY